MSRLNLFNRLFILGVIVVSLALTGCVNKSGSITSHALRAGLNFTEPVPFDNPYPDLYFDLNYNLPEIKELHYIKTENRNTYSMMMGMDIKVKIQKDIDYIIKGAGVDRQNNYTGDILVNRLDLSVIRPGKDIPTKSSATEEALKIVFSPKGKIIELSSASPTGKGEINVKNHIEDDLLINLPDETLQVGKVWTTPIEIRKVEGKEGGETLIITAKGETVSVVEGIETINGLECIKINTLLKGTIEQTGQVIGNKSSGNGEILRSSVWHFAYKEGIFVKSSTQEIRKTKQKIGPSMEMSVTEIINTDINLIEY